MAFPYPLDGCVDPPLSPANTPPVRKRAIINIEKMKNY